MRDVPWSALQLGCHSTDITANADGDSTIHPPSTALAGKWLCRCGRTCLLCIDLTLQSWMVLRAQRTATIGRTKRTPRHANTTPVHHCPACDECIASSMVCYLVSSTFSRRSSDGGRDRLPRWQAADVIAIHHHSMHMLGEALSCQVENVREKGEDAYCTTAGSRRCYRGVRGWGSPSAGRGERG